jgi:hypothetical protein
MEDDLTTARFLHKEASDSHNPIQDHIDTLADRLEKAYYIVRKNNEVGRRRHKEQYDKGTQLVNFQPGEMAYLREMGKGRYGCPKFRFRWKGPYEVMWRLSDLNYLVKIARNKEVIVNVNKMKKCCTRTIQQWHRMRDPNGGNSGSSGG